MLLVYPSSVLLSVFVFVGDWGCLILMSAIYSGITSRGLRKSAEISGPVAEALTFFIIVLRYRIKPLMMHQIMVIGIKFDTTTEMKKN